jgi:hypothetical protein
MQTACLIADDFGNPGRARTCTAITGNGSINSAIARKIKELYSSKTAEILAAWLKISLRTAKHRLCGEREFTLDEIAALLHSEHGFKILTALMSEAKRKPAWWTVCEPLMDVVDAERMAMLLRKRVTKAMSNYEEADAVLNEDIRRAETLAIRGSGPARAHADALRAIAGKAGRVVAPKKR